MDIYELVEELISMYVCKVEIDEDYYEDKVYVSLKYQNGTTEEIEYIRSEKC